MYHSQHWLKPLHHRPPASSTRSKRPPLWPLDTKLGSRRSSQSSPMADTKSEPSGSSSSGQSSSIQSGPSSSGASNTTFFHDSSLAPAPFQGTTKENAQEWLNYFIRYAEFKQLQDRSCLALFALLMSGTANTWFSSLSISDDDGAQYITVIERFRAKYAPASISLWRRATDFWNRDQRPHETVEEYYSDMTRRARELQASNDMVRYAIMR